MSFSAIDIVFIVLILIFSVRCAVKGFVSELMSMAAIVLGLLAALFLYKNGAEYIRTKIMHEVEIVPEVIAFIALFAVVFILVKILEAMLKGIVNGIKLGGADRFLGIFFGIAEGIVVVSLALFVLQIQPLFDSAPLIESSFFAGLIMPLIARTGSN